MSFFKTGLDYSQDEAGASGLRRPGLDYKDKAGSINSAVASSSVASSGIETKISVELLIDTAPKYPPAPPGFCVS